MKSERQHREDLVRFGKYLHDKGFVAATDGNLSVRLDHDTVLATPTSMSKGMMEPEDMVVVDMKGKKITGRRNVSSEIAMHLLIYRLRSDVKGVVHAHPPTATGYAAAGIALNQALISEIVFALGCIPLAKYGTPGTPELTDALEPLIPQFDALLMANHGVVCYAEDVLRAYMKMETVEHFAKIALVTHQLGRANLLSNEEVGKLMVQREKYEGITSAPPMSVSCPVTLEVATAAAAGAGPKPVQSAGASGNQEQFLVTRDELLQIVEDAVRQTSAVRGGKRKW